MTRSKSQSQTPANVSHIDALRKLESDYSTKKAELLEKARVEASAEVSLIGEKLVALHVDFPEIVVAMLTGLNRLMPQVALSEPAKQPRKARETAGTVSVTDADTANVLASLNKKTAQAASDIAGKLKLDRLVVSRALAGLRANNQAKSEGKGRGARWLLV